MTKQERNKLYKKAVEKWGEDSQLDQMIEEMAELTVAINKYKRAKHFVAQKKEGVLDNLYEELADVKMCLEQMEWIFGKDNIEQTLEQKFKKFIKQLNE
ncbi:MAG: hypothetical protein ACI4TT_03470 [Christensenellales bacterium]